MAKLLPDLQDHAARIAQTRSDQNLAALRKELLAKIENAVPVESAPATATAQPPAAETLPVTDDQVALNILWYLHNFRAWGGRHTSEKHFARGPNSHLPWRRVAAVIKALHNKGFLVPHSKEPDEHYSLNPAKVKEILRLLGVEDPHAVQKAETASREPEVVADEETECVSLAQFEHTIMSVREQLRRIENRPHLLPTTSGEEVARVREEFKAVEGQVRGLQSIVTGFEKRLQEILAGHRREVANLQEEVRRAVRRPKTKARSEG